MTFVVFAALGNRQFGWSPLSGETVGRASSPKPSRLSSIRVSSIVLISSLLLLGAGPAPAMEKEGSSLSLDFVSYLMDLGLYPEAGAEARRLIVSGALDEYPSPELSRMATVMAANGELMTAYALMEAAMAGSRDEAFVAETSLAAAVLLLKLRSYPRAIHILARLEAFSEDEAIRARAWQLRCIGHAYAGDTEATRDCAGELEVKGPEEQEMVEDLLKRLAVDPSRRAIVGGALSAIVPGLGQLTAGEPLDAALAMLLNGAIGAGTYLLLVDGAIFDASLLIMAVGLRYYVGNIQNGASAWRRRAHSRREEASEILMDLFAVSMPESDAED